MGSAKPDPYESSIEQAAWSKTIEELQDIGNFRTVLLYNSDRFMLDADLGANTKAPTPTLGSLKSSLKSSSHMPPNSHIPIIPTPHPM